MTNSIKFSYDGSKSIVVDIISSTPTIVKSEVYRCNGVGCQKIFLGTATTRILSINFMPFSQNKANKDSQNEGLLAFYKLLASRQGNPLLVSKLNNNEVKRKFLRIAEINLSQMIFRSTPVKELHKNVVRFYKTLNLK